MDCIFCKIIKKEIPANIVYENEDVLAFLDIQPVRTGHTLIVPKNHESHFTKLNESEYNKLMKVAHAIARKIEKEINPARVGMMIQGFDVPHVHVHIIPMEDSHDISTCRTCTGAPSPENLTETAKLLHIES